MSGLAQTRAALVCHDCDELHAMPKLEPGESAYCSRCGGVLARGKRDVAVRTFAFSLASLFLLALANSFPFMEFEMAGRVQVTRLWTGVTQLYSDGYWELSLIVLFASIVAPVLLLTSLSLVCGSMLLGQRYTWMPALVKLATRLKNWSMMEVFLIGIGVSTIKLAQIADITQGPSLFAFVGLILTSSWALSAFEPDVVWSYLDGEESA